MISKITLIGSGNVATNLGMAFREKGLSIHEVYSRNRDHAGLLAEKLNASTAKNLAGLSADTDLFIIAVSDDKIGAVAAGIPHKNILTAHTSGSVSLETIQKHFPQNGGVFYPLQSLSASRPVTFDDVPLCIEGATPKVTQDLMALGKKISAKTVEMNSEKRGILHLAAVFANNFPNHLFAIADEILEENQLPFDLLKPLISRTAEKIQTDRPVAVQTGPAVRNDMETIEKHLKMLKNEDHKALYKLFNRSILRLKKSVNS